MEYTIKLMLLAIISFYINGCTSTDAVPDITELKLELVILDGWSGSEKDTFNLEDDITLALKATNHSNDSITLGYYHELSEIMDNNEEFFFVYERIPSGQLLPIGRPYQLPLHWLMVLQPIYILPESEKFLTMARWLNNPDNSRLKAGTYYSRFQIELDNKEFKSEVTFIIE